MSNRRPCHCSEVKRALGHKRITYLSAAVTYSGVFSAVLMNGMRSFSAVNAKEERVRKRERRKRERERERERGKESE